MRPSVSRTSLINVISLALLLLLTALYTYSFTGFSLAHEVEAAAPATLPFLERSRRAGVYNLEGTLTVRPLSPRQYTIIADDGLLELHINDVQVDLTGIAEEDLFNWQYGFTIDLGPYLTERSNHIHFVFSDLGGLYGVKMISDPTEARLLPLRLLWAACLAVLIWNTLMYLRVRRDLALLVGVGIGVRILYTIITDFNVRGHDTDEHLEYVLHFVNSWKLPDLEAATGGAYFHPPLYYFVAALFYRLADFFQPDQPRFAYGVLQYLSVAFSAGFLLYSALLIHKVFDHLFGSHAGRAALSPRHFRFATALAMALLVFWPSAVLHSPRIGNDPLLYFLFAGGLYYIYSFFVEPSARAFILGAICAALAVITKANGIILGAVGAMALLTIWWVRRPPLNFALLKQGTLPVAILLAAATLAFYPGLALKLKGDRTHLYIDNITNISSALKVGNGAGNYLWMDLKTFLTEPYTSPYEDEFGRQYFANYLSKTGLVGEWTFPGKWAANSAGVLSFSYVLLMILFIVGLYHYRRGDYTHLSPLLWVYGLLLASVYYMRMTFPANIDFRYVLPLLVPFAVLYNVGLARLYQGGKPRLAATGYAVEIAFVASSIAFLLHFGFRYD